MRTKNQYSSFVNLTNSRFEHLNENSLLIRGGADATAATNSTSSNYQCDATKVCCTMPPQENPHNN